MRILRSSVAVACLCGMVGAVQAEPQTWVGEYAYAASHGKSQGGSVIGAEYLVRIVGTGPVLACEIEIAGYQRFEEILCTTTVSGDSITLGFTSYKSGGVKNAYGVQIYRVGQPLLRFERVSTSDRRVLLTHWLGIRDTEGKNPQRDETFVRVASRK